MTAQVIELFSSNQPPPPSPDELEGQMSELAERAVSIERDGGSAGEERSRWHELHDLWSKLRGGAA